MLVTDERPKQVNLDGPSRRDAAEGKHEATQRLDGRTAILMDDIYTTGHTLHGAARACVDAGADRVIGVVLARRVFSDGMAICREATGG